MGITSKTNSRIDDYRSLHPIQFQMLGYLQLEQHEDDQAVVLKLEHVSEARYLLLTFEGVTGLEFLPGEFQPIPLSIEIAWITERQWEGKNYQIFNAEQDVKLSFYCRDFQAVTQDYHKASLMQSDIKSDQEYEAEVELLMQELAELTKPVDTSQMVREQAEAEQLRAEIKALRTETRAMLVNMGANF